MKRLLKAVFDGAVGFQHTHLPMPLAAFDQIFRSKRFRGLAGRYGQACFDAHYHRKRHDIGNLGYWMSEDSLYWHFWRQTDTSPEAIRTAANHAPPLADARLKAAELGFGIGKNRFFHRDLLPFETYVGVEPNPHCAAVARQRMPDIEVVEQTSLEYVESSAEFDVLLVFGGVLMYMTPDDIDRMFVSLGRRQLKAILILDEGMSADSPDVVRADGTTMYNFQKRLIANGYGDRKFYVEQQADRPINRLLAMW